MIENTPKSVAKWLRDELASCPPDDPDRPIFKALAEDERMEGLWDANEAGNWPPFAQCLLVDYVTFLRKPEILAILEKPPAERTFRPAAELAAAADRLLQSINDHRGIAAALVAGDVSAREINLAKLNELVNAIDLLARTARSAASTIGSRLAHVPEPTRRGPGDPRQRAYRVALDDGLTRLPGVTTTQEQRDRIVALLCSVIFGGEIDAGSIARTRQRRNRRRRKEKSRQFGME